MHTTLVCVVSPLLKASTGLLKAGGLQLRLARNYTTSQPQPNPQLLTKLIQTYREQARTKHLQALEEALKQVSTLNIRDQQLFFKFVLGGVASNKLPFQHAQYLKQNMLIRDLPHLMIEADILEIDRSRDQQPQDKQYRFKQAYKKLTLIKEPHTQHYMQGTLDRKYGNYLKASRPEDALKCFERAITSYSEVLTFEVNNFQNFLKTQKEKAELPSSAPSSSANKQQEISQIKANGMKEIIKGFIESIAQLAHECFMISYQKKKFDDCETFLKKGIEVYQKFPAVKEHSPQYLVLNRLWLELRYKYRKQPKEVIAKDLRALYELGLGSLAKNRAETQKYGMNLMLIKKALNDSADAESRLKLNQVYDSVIEDIEKKISPEQQELVILHKIKEKLIEQVPK